MSNLQNLCTHMKGSGRAHMPEEIYSVNAVKHVISGKIILKALRVHVLVGCAFTEKLQKQVISSKQPENVQSKFSKSEKSNMKYS